MGYDLSSSESAGGTLITMVDKKTGHHLSYCRFFNPLPSSGGLPQLPPLSGPKQIQPPPDLGCSWVAAEKARCRFHGGLSTGPRTAAGKARSAKRRRWASPRRSRHPCTRRAFAQSVR